MYLNATIYTPVGVFKGTVNKFNQPVSKQELVEIRDNLQENSLSFLVVFAGEKEITIPRNMLQNSVIEYSITEHPAA